MNWETFQSTRVASQKKVVHLKYVLYLKVSVDLYIYRFTDLANLWTLDAALKATGVLI